MNISAEVGGPVVKLLEQQGDETGGGAASLLIVLREVEEPAQHRLLAVALSQVTHKLLDLARVGRSRAQVGVVPVIDLQGQGFGKVLDPVDDCRLAIGTVDLEPTREFGVCRIPTQDLVEHRLDKAVAGIRHQVERADALIENVLVNTGVGRGSVRRMGGEVPEGTVLPGDLSR